MVEEKEFQTVGAAIWNKHEPKWMLVQETYKLAEEYKRKVGW